jgi:hypothetical protein
MEDLNPFFIEPFGLQHDIGAFGAWRLKQVAVATSEIRGPCDNGSVKLGDLVFGFLSELDHDFSL